MKDSIKSKRAPSLIALQQALGKNVPKPYQLEQRILLDGTIPVAPALLDLPDSTQDNTETASPLTDTENQATTNDQNHAEDSNADIKIHTTNQRVDFDLGDFLDGKIDSVETYAAPLHGSISVKDDRISYTADDGHSGSDMLLLKVHYANDDFDAIEVEINVDSYVTASNEAVLHQVLQDGEMPSEVIFVDSAVQDQDSLLRDIDDDVAVFTLESHLDGVHQMHDILEALSSHDDFSGVDALHVLTHGDEATIHLGNTNLTLASMLGQHQEALTSLSSFLSAEADILIYGCEFGRGDAGGAAANMLANLTQADIAASVDLTGAAAQGGDWDLEVNVGSVEALSLAPTHYSHILNSSTGVLTNDLTLTDDAGSTSSSISGLTGVADFNNDNKNDIYVATDSGVGNSSVHLNNGSGQFESQPVLYTYEDFGTGFTTDFAFADFDGNGFLDIFETKYNPGFDTAVSNNVWLNLGNSNGTWQGFKAIDSTTTIGNSRSYQVSVGDIDGDGDIDAFVANYFSSTFYSSFDDTVYNPHPNVIWFNKGTVNGVWQGFEEITSVQNTLGKFGSKAVELYDLDGDGTLDLYMGNHENDHRLLDTSSHPDGRYAFTLADRSILNGGLDSSNNWQGFSAYTNSSIQDNVGTDGFHEIIHSWVRTPDFALHPDSDLEADLEAVGYITTDIDIDKLGADGNTYAATLLEPIITQYDTNGVQIIYTSKWNLYYQSTSDGRFNSFIAPNTIDLHASTDSISSSFFNSHVYAQDIEFVDINQDDVKDVYISTSLIEYRTSSGSTIEHGVSPDTIYLTTKSTANNMVKGFATASNPIHTTSYTKGQNIFLGDVDNDSDQDLILSHGKSGGVDVWSHEATPSTVSGIVWSDVNANGTFDVAEDSAFTSEAVTIKLYQAPYGGTGTTVIGTNPIATTKTSTTDGSYSFSGLAAGSYQLEIVVPNSKNLGTYTAYASDSSAATIKSNFDSTDRRTQVLTVNSTATTYVLDAGFPDIQDTDGDGVDDSIEGLTADTDGDGTKDYLDTDDDGDGILTSEEATKDNNDSFIDTDGDGTPNYIDNDDDGDGIYTILETNKDNEGNYQNTNFGIDTFGKDQIPDYLDNDDDGDGILTAVEVNNQTIDTAQKLAAAPNSDSNYNPTGENNYTNADNTPDYLDLDSDGDSVLDKDEGSGDVDNDSIASFRDVDDDGDGIDTIFERNYTTFFSDKNTDGDSLVDRLDTDDDGDGIDTKVEGTADPDNDNKPNYIDDDSDGDGISDATETADDFDSDETPNYLDDDSDNDGIPDSTEGTTNTDNTGNANFLDTDSDDDGIPDSTETATDTDNDGDGNYIDFDSDDDGIRDSVEGLSDSDSDGTPNYLDTDSDGDGINDIDEGNTDSDSDGTPNYLDDDSDGDGILDKDEYKTGLASDVDGDGTPNYIDADSDGDGINDSQEGNTDSDNDGILNAHDLDDDGDGINSLSEDRNGDGNISNDDTDSDGLPDYLDTDDDGDGVSTYDEVGDRDGTPNNATDTDSDGAKDYLDVDDDGDGILTIHEDTNKDGNPTNDNTDSDLKANYLDADDDGDGLNTADEIGAADNTGANATDTDGDNTPNYLDVDDDGDTIQTISERNSAANSGVNDFDGDGTVNWLDADDDGDGVTTAKERSLQIADIDGDGKFNWFDLDDDGDGVLSKNETRAGHTPNTLDSDGDGIINALDTDDDGDGLLSKDEDVDGDGDPSNDGGFNPYYLTQDADGDYILDGVEGLGDFDGDGIPDFVDTDVDNDGISDFNEYKNPEQIDLNALVAGLDESVIKFDFSKMSHSDIDGDGIPNHKDLDSDNDGIPDALEGHPGTLSSGLGGVFTFVNKYADGQDLGGTVEFSDVDAFGQPSWNQDGKITENEAKLIRTQLGVPETVDVNGDGLANFRDADIDSDNAHDFLDPDSDGDGLPDIVEINPTYDFNRDAKTDLLDADRDRDGIFDFLDLDSDNDGISDKDEQADGIADTDSKPHDSDNDGIIDRLDTDVDNDDISDEIERRVDSDGDGIYDYRDRDSDADGIPDDVEKGDDLDGDGTRNYLDLDADGDGINDAVEGRTDTDGDGTPNFLEVDSDNDNIGDKVEGTIDSDGDGKQNYVDTDSDNDGLPDSLEGLGNPDRDSLPNYIDRDSDNDTIDDSFESFDGDRTASNGQKVDTDDDQDNDGLKNYHDTDSDGDGIPDSIEGRADPDGDNRLSYLDLDSDADGINDQVEGSDDIDGDGNRNFVDTDADGDNILDATEGTVDTDGDGTANYKDTDSDGDTINDSIEGTTDTDGDSKANYVDTDADGDGIADSIEGSHDADKDGKGNYIDLDSDNDTITDKVEGFADPDNDRLMNFLDIDSDNDDILDRVEGTRDSDGDGQANFVDMDSDGDSLTDKSETANDVDGDGLPNYLDLNSDGDYLLDANDSQPYKADPKPVTNTSTAKAKSTSSSGASETTTSTEANTTSGTTAKISLADVSKSGTPTKVATTTSSSSTTSTTTTTSQSTTTAPSSVSVSLDSTSNSYSVSLGSSISAGSTVSLKSGTDGSTYPADKVDLQVEMVDGKPQIKIKLKEGVTAEDLQGEKIEVKYEVCNSGQCSVNTIQVNSGDSGGSSDSTGNQEGGSESNAKLEELEGKQRELLAAYYGDDLSLLDNLSLTFEDDIELFPHLAESKLFQLEQQMHSEGQVNMAELAEGKVKGVKRA